MYTLAKESGITRRMVQRVEEASSACTLPLLEKMARALKVPLKSLVP